MPTSREVIVNKPLTGEEVKAILHADFEKLLLAEGILSSHIAFGRLAYQFELRLHTGNIHLPVSITRHGSRFDPVYPQLEPAPLTPQPIPSDQNLTAHTVSREITSPNIERIRHGLPVEVQHKTQEGSIEREKLVYPRDPDNIPEAEGPGNMTITDTTSIARADWGVLDQPLDVSIPNDISTTAADTYAQTASAEAEAEAAAAANQPPNT